MLGHTLRSSHAVVKLTWRGPATVSIIVAALQYPAVKAPREIKRRLDAIAQAVVDALSQGHKDVLEDFTR